MKRNFVSRLLIVIPTQIANDFNEYWKEFCNPEFNLNWKFSYTRHVAPWGIFLFFQLSEIIYVQGAILVGMNVTDKVVSFKIL